ncbi:MAG: DUF2029 domain-containing protein [Candidatus Altiarchaeales archaeon]|nr:DUF2029 domain-containing protein [Candidatus Altiarchaeales archaeon]MBD3416422.1 DUF2029 domain-containing protein [Candidatus Altiarchaeales archaeon]
MSGPCSNCYNMENRRQDLPYGRLESVALIPVLLVLLWSFFMYSGLADLQWDFPVYYYTAKMHSMGVGLYDSETLLEIAPYPINTYVYPPLTVYFFKPFSFFEYGLAQHVFLGVKLLLVGVLLSSWRDFFLKRDVDVFYYGACLLAYNMTLIRDLIGGNISVFEQAFLWSGFYFLLRGRHSLFSLFVLAASSFKLNLIVFLGLVLLVGDNARYRVFLRSAFVFSLYLVFSYLASPSQFDSYVNSANLSVSIPNERGVLNPCMPELLGDLSDILRYEYGIFTPGILWQIIYLLTSLTVLLLTLKAFMVLRSSSASDWRRMILFLSTVAFALVMPRFKDYSYILLLPATYFILRRPKYVRHYNFLVMATYFVIPIFSSGLKYPFTLLEYYPLFMAYAVWVMYLKDVFSDR